VKTLFTVGCLAVLALAAGSVAKANDLNLKGPYIGVAIGDFVARSDAQTTTVFSPTGYFAMTSVTAIGVSGAQRTKPSGFIGSGLVGYNFIQNGNVVVGAEVDFSVLHANDVMTVTANYPCCAGTAFTITQQVSANWLGTARPRVGYLAGSVLIYATGGLAVTHTDMHELFTDTFAAAPIRAGACSPILDAITR
jgi:outer membrane immunogenic protein